MSENKIFIAAGSEFVNNKNSWQHICKEKLNYDIFDLTKEKISNALISRNVIYKVNELIKTNYKTDDIVVGIMWTIPMIHERYIPEGKNDNYMNKSETGFTSVVDNLKNWRILNHDCISSSEDCELYFKIMYNKLQSYVLSMEHILRTQWFLNKLGIKYFMTSYVDFFHNEENYLKMYDFSKLTDYKKRNYNLNILMYNEVDYLYAMIDMKRFLPIYSMLDWAQENYPIDGFSDSEKLKSNDFANEKFTTEVILPFLKNTYNLEPNKISKLI
jgi:hypothetical protein